MSAELIDRFRARLEQLLGLAFPPGHQNLLAEILKRRAGRRSQESYLDELESRRDGEEISQLALEVTVGETYFFRHWHQLQTFSQLAVPERLEARRQTRRLNILSVGCSTGEEPYSLAMLLRQNFALSDWKISLTGVDVNRKSLSHARLGLYSNWSVRDTPAHLLQRWFAAKGQNFRLDDDILQAVQFEERNLNSLNADLWLPGRWDIIFCRNMMMYLAPDSARQLVENFARSLMEDGFLFLGPAENLRGLSQDFNPHYREQSFYYQLAPKVAVELSAVPAAAPRPPVRRPPVSRPVGESIRQLLDSERYAQALEKIEALPASPETSLWKAAVLVNSGQLDLAEELCRGLVHQRGTEAGAHLLIGLCRREAGDWTASQRYFEQATRLDPSLALARVYLGMLARRQGLHPLARTNLRQGLALLEKENEERMQLFGGGFRRNAWLALCQSELERCPAR